METIEVEAKPENILGLTPRQIRRMEPSPEPEIRPCANCGHPVILSDGRAIHAASSMSITHRCYIDGCRCYAAKWPEESE